MRGIFFIWSLFSSGNPLSCHTVVERFQTMNDFGGNVWVVIEKSWHKKMFGEKVKKGKKMDLEQTLLIGCGKKN